MASPSLSFYYRNSQNKKKVSVKLDILCNQPVIACSVRSNSLITEYR